MKLLVDENLPLEFLDLLSTFVSSVHVNLLKTRKNQRIVDDQLRRYSLNHGYAIITKDDDFVKSFVDRKVPEKLIFIYHQGKKNELINEIGPQLEVAVALLKEYNFIEISKKGIRLPFEIPLPYKK